ncbi:hypothetical protein J6590_030084 [Homalodisca vitripennis]|nr:hypothetical protein J6590_030084 [Homalodisca vitripennis]
MRPEMGACHTALADLLLCKHSLFTGYTPHTGNTGHTLFPSTISHTVPIVPTYSAAFCVGVVLLVAVAEVHCGRRWRARWNDFSSEMCYKFPQEAISLMYAFKSSGKACRAPLATWSAPVPAQHGSLAAMARRLTVTFTGLTGHGMAGALQTLCNSCGVNRPIVTH